MVDINKLMSQLVNNSFAGGVAGGLASSLLTSKSGRKMGKKALKYGGLAAVGALAYTAYQRYSKTGEVPLQVTGNNQNTPTVLEPPPDSQFLSSTHQENQDDIGLILVRAMIAAARADGRLDAQESQTIFQKITALGLDTDSQNLLIQEMGQPVDIDAIVNAANTIEIASEIYIASLMAIEVDNIAEQSYLAMLSARLKLPPELTVELEAEVAKQKLS